MRRRSSCAAAFRDGTRYGAVIGKVLRGRNARRLLYYLYGPGKANEHTDPHLVAGFADPADLEPERRQDGSRDFRRLAGLLDQSLAGLAGPGYAEPVWHCAVRAAPEDRMLSDAEWAQVAAGIMHRTGLAREGDDQGVRWVAVRHGDDHVHLVATLARTDGTRPRVWNDFYRVREACQEAEARFGLRSTAPADRTADHRPGRAETEQAARRGWAEVPRVRLCREVATAAAGAGTEQEFFGRLAAAGVAVRLRHSTVHPGQVTGYAVGLADHTGPGGGVIWYGGGKLAADLTLPKLRHRWTSPGGPLGSDLPAGAARAALRNMVTAAARRARDEAGFFAELQVAGVQVRLRFSDRDPGQVTGYSVTLPGHTGGDGQPAWYGGGRLAENLTLPRLRSTWDPRAGTRGTAGTPRCTAAEREAIYAHAACQAARATEHIRRCALTDPAGAADAAWAAADTLHVAARALRNPELRRAATSYARAARAGYGRIPPPSPGGAQLRATARLLSLTGQLTGTSTLAAAALIADLAALVLAIAELRAIQQHTAQATAARHAAAHLHHCTQPRPAHRPSPARHPGQPSPAPHLARQDTLHRPGQNTPSPATPVTLPPRPGSPPGQAPRRGP